MHVRCVTPTCPRYDLPVHADSDEVTHRTPATCPGCDGELAVVRGAHTDRETAVRRAPETR